MMTELAKGSLPALLLFSLHVGGLFINPNVAFIGFLAFPVWLLISSVRLAQESVRGTYKGTAYSADKETFAYWLWAFWACLLVVTAYFGMFFLGDWLEIRTSSSILGMCAMLSIILSISVGATLLDPTTKRELEVRVLPV